MNSNFLKKIFKPFRTFFPIIFLKLGFSPCEAGQPPRGMELQEKKFKRRLKYAGKFFRNTLQKKVSFNSRLKAIYIIGQRKAFYSGELQSLDVLQQKLLT